MSLDAMSFFKLASQRMHWLSARQRVVAENIANADTPGYRAQDVAGFDEHLRAARRPHVAAADTALAPHQAEVSVQESAAGWGGSFNGNTVTLEQQTVLAAETAENHKLAARLYRKGFDLLSLAATSR